MTLSERIRVERVARGWTIDEVGAKLRLPARLVVRVEEGDFASLGAPVYQRGYLRSFARLLDIPEADVEAALGGIGAAEPELVATGVMARSEYVAERYLRPASYIALTALIALPVVWWAASGRVGPEPMGPGALVALDGGPGSRVSANAPAFDVERPAPPPVDIGPDPKEVLRASLLPSPRPEIGDPVRIAADTAAEPEASVATGTDAGANVIGSGAHEAVLSLTGSSWVEVVDADGRRVHQALLPGGEWRFRADAPLSFIIGNSRNASLTVDGASVDLESHRSPNDVARVSVFAANGNG
jgi:cytoskeleton protein RodZ